jgi:hypothetical protein
MSQSGGQYFFQNLLEAGAHAQRHRLPGGPGAFAVIERRGEVIATGCAAQRKLTECREQRGDGDFARFPDGAAGFFGAAGNEIRAQTRGAKKGLEKAAGGR